MIGPVANSVCIVAGSILGALCGPVLSQEFRKKIMNVFSCITLGIGVTMLSKGDSLPPVVLSLLFGTALGELTRFESLVMKGAFKVAGLFKRNGKAKGGKSETLSETVFRDQFAVATVLFCVSGLGIIGSMREGLTGECSLLLIKGVLDLFTAMLISASIGSVVGVLAVPQCAIQFALLFGATMLMPYTTPTMFADFSACGGKIPAEDKSKVQAGIDKLKETLKGTDTAAIKAATDALTQDFYAVSEKLYQQANPQGAQGGAQAGPDMGGQQGGNAQGGQYYDADYKVVDDDDQNKK